MVIIAVIRLAMCGQGRFTGKIVHAIEQQWGHDLIGQCERTLRNRAQNVGDHGPLPRLPARSFRPHHGRVFRRVRIGRSVALGPDAGRVDGVLLAGTVAPTIAPSTLNCLPRHGRAPMLRRCSASARHKPQRSAPSFSSGEFSATVELRRLFPGIADTEQAREYARTIANRRPLPRRLRPVRLRAAK
jgi:hypothetical protein